MSQANGKTKFYDKILRNTPFGMLLGAILALILAAALDTWVSDDLVKISGSIFSTIATLLAASLALTGVFSSIENQQNINRENRQKKLMAARAFLPSALSRMSSICKSAIRYSHKFDTFEATLGAAEFEKVSKIDLVLSDEIITIFKEVIELTEDNVVADRLSGLLREHQIFLSRWKSAFSEGMTRHPPLSKDGIERTVGWAYLAAICASIFDYARRNTQTIESGVTEDLIFNSIFTAELDDLEGDNVRAAVGLYERTFLRRFAVLKEA